MDGGQTAEAGSIGGSSRDDLGMISTEPLAADRCDHCRFIIRRSVEQMGKKWPGTDSPARARQTMPMAWSLLNRGVKGMA